MTTSQILEISFGFYAVSVAIFLISENRAPKSSFAWMLLFIVLPGLGLAVYLFLGRGHEAFVRRFRVTEQDAPVQMQGLLDASKEEHNAALGVGSQRWCIRTQTRGSQHQIVLRFCKTLTRLIRHWLLRLRRLSPQSICTTTFGTATPLVQSY